MKLTLRCHQLHKFSIHEKSTFENLQKSLGVKTLEDWYGVPEEKVLKRGGAVLLKKYGDSLYNLLSDYFPHHSWQGWRFETIPKDYWNKASKTTRREYFDWLEQELGIKSKEEWYEVHEKALQHQKLKDLLSVYHHSLPTALMDVYPHHTWLPWKFVHLKDDWFDQLDNQRFFFDWMMKELKLQHLEDWYDMKLTDTKHSKFHQLLKKYYDHNLFEALKTLYPKTEWVPWKFKHSSSKYWSDPSSHKAFFDHLFKEWNMKSMEDWYKVSMNAIKEVKGSGFLGMYYEDNLYLALSKLYPENEWIPWKFPSMPQGYWKKSENQKAFFDYLAKLKSVQSEEDWYRVIISDVKEAGGGGLLANYFDNSLSKALEAVYPEYQWKPWRFQNAPRGVTLDKNHQKEMFDSYAKEKNFSSRDDWYKVKVKDLKMKGIGGVMTTYKDSLFKALTSIYPDVDWQPWRFESIPKNYWQSEENIKHFLEWMAKHYHITQMEDWYSLSRNHFLVVGGAKLIAKYGGVAPLLMKYFPNFKWEIHRFTLDSSVNYSQKFLFATLKEMFPSVEIHMGFKHPDLKFENSDKPMELDVYIPSLQLAFEYQGEQHYSTHYLYSSSDEVQRRDQEKQQV